MNKSKFKRTQIPDTEKFKVNQADNTVKSVAFSFKFFDFNSDIFCFNHKEYNYFECLLYRLKDLSTMTAIELISNKSKAIRFHRIDWDKTAQKNGFTNLNEQFKLYPPYQFSLSSNEHGRVHGFFMDNIFHIVWFDPEHKLYS